mmetsp:Transcript_4941/g.7377  ORF Transcript_4941/g.7377 Transcript_4941/m.7377 type:complete len:340 (-) Transcript_4941:398-1417(-)
MRQPMSIVDMPSSYIKLTQSSPYFPFPMPWKRRSANWCPLLRHQATAEHCKQFEEHHQCKLERHRQAAVQWWQRGAPHYKLQTLSEDDEQLLAGARRRADLWTKGFVQLRIPTAELGWRQNKLVARLQQLTTAAEGWADVLFEGFRKNGETVAPKGGLRTLKPLEDAELETLIREVIFHYFPDLADLGVWKPAGIATLTNAQSQFRHLDLEWISADGQHLVPHSLLQNQSRLPTNQTLPLDDWVLQLTEDANQEKARAEKWEADITEGLLLPPPPPLQPQFFAIRKYCPMPVLRRRIALLGRPPRLHPFPPPPPPPSPTSARSSCSCTRAVRSPGLTEG